MSTRRLYDFLPSIYRIRDEQPIPGVRLDGNPGQVPPLKALFAIFQTLYDELESDIGALYCDWFIETCTPEMFSSFAELLAIRDLTSFQKGGADVRALIANMIGYRQRKGTVAALQGAARDATGWAVQVIDGLQSTASNVRIDEKPFVGYVDVRMARLMRDDALRMNRVSLDVRNSVAGLRQVRLDVWRAKAALVKSVEPFQFSGNSTRFTFSALGHDKALMRPSQVGDDAADYFYGVPLTRADARADLAKNGALSYLRIRDSAGRLQRLEIADLSAWDEPQAENHVNVRVDPELGRLMAPDSNAHYRLDYYIARYHDVGAGVASRPWPGTFDLTLLVAPTGEPGTCATLEEALDEVAAARSGTRARILVGDSATHRPQHGSWKFAPTGSVVEISIESAPGARPTLDGSLTIVRDTTNRIVRLRGLNMRGTVVCGARTNVVFESMTLLGPGAPYASIAPAIEAPSAGARAWTRVTIERSIIDAATFGNYVEVVVSDSIVMGSVSGDKEQAGFELVARTSTFLGPVSTGVLTGSDALFDRPIIVGSPHRGYARYCMFRPGSVTSQRYRCVETDTPVIASARYGRLGFARIRDGAPVAIAKGASNGLEIGAMNHCGDGGRAANLDRIREEFVPEGVGVNIVYRS